MFDDASTDELIKLANDAASLAARNYFGIDAEDIASNTLEVVFKSPARFERHLEHRGWLWSVFYAESVKYCNKCVRDFMFYSDKHYYTPQEVRELLERAYRTDVQDDEVIHINEATVSMIDLAVAFERLKFTEKDIIARKLRNGEKLVEADRKAYYRATERLAGILNRGTEDKSKSRVTHEGPGSRKAISNEEAQYIIRSQNGGW